MNRNLRELADHLSEQVAPLHMPTVEDIQDAIMDGYTQADHDRQFERTGMYDIAYLDRVVLLLEIEALQAKLAGALTSQREDGAPF